jgi:hypothetical protein
VAEKMCTDIAEACAASGRDNNLAHPDPTKCAVRGSDADEYTTIGGGYRSASAQIGDH